MLCLGRRHISLPLTRLAPSSYLDGLGSLHRHHIELLVV